MSFFPNEEKDIFYALDKSFSCYWQIFKKIIPWAFFLTLTEGIATYGNAHLSNSIFYWLCLGLESLVFLFFFGAMFYQANSILEERSVALSDACRVMLQRFVPMYLTFVVFLVFIVGYSCLSYYVMHLISKNAHAGHFLLNLFFLFSLALLMVFIVFFLFSLPLILLDGFSPLKAIMQSYQLSRSRPAPIFTVYASMALIAVAVFPRTKHAHFLMQHHVWLLFDFVMYCILLPFVVNYMLFILNDLKVRFRNLDK